MVCCSTRRFYVFSSFIRLTCSCSIMVHKNTHTQTRTHTHIHNYIHRDTLAGSYLLVHIYIYCVYNIPLLIEMECESEKRKTSLPAANVTMSKCTALDEIGCISRVYETPIERDENNKSIAPDKVIWQVKNVEKLWRM